MATFIPEWHKLSGAELQIKRTLGTLDDGHFVRRPLRPGCPAEIFVQHRAEGWLAIAVSFAEFADVGLSHMFEQDGRERFEQRLAQLQRLGAGPDTQAPGMAVLVLMWACSSEEVRVLTKAYLGRFGTRLVSREQFQQLGAKLAHGLLGPLPEAHEQQLLATWFPEAEIPAMFTTRRFLQRDNSARLGRYFLDHEQEWAAKLDLEMPAEQRETASDFSVRLLNGVAGSGKTLIAINRALLLAELFPRQRILVLIHNTPIVADLRVRLRRLRKGLPANLEMQTVFAWLYRQWRQVFGKPPRMPDDPGTLPGLVQHHRLRWPDLKASTATLVDEFDFINDSLITDEQSYLSASRAGRGFALRAPERAQVWRLYETVTAELQRSGMRAWSALPREIAMAQDHHARLARYEHIIVDEAQFCAPSWFEVMKLCLAEQGQLFLCADPTQGFLKNRLSWKRAGLDVAGRTKRLRRSYRTTRAILETATAVRAALGPGDDEDCVEPDYAGMDPGDRPLLVYADSPQDAIDRLCNELAELVRHKAVPLGAFLVIYGESVNKRMLYSELRRRLGFADVWWLNEREQKKEPPGGHGGEYLRMAYLDTATGLEGCYVFLLGVEDLFSSVRVADQTDEEQAARREGNARRLYMAMTRAGQRLVVVAAQPLPGGLEDLFEHPPSNGVGQSVASKTMSSSGLH